MKKTNVSVNKFSKPEYPGLGVYENTDDTGMVEIIIVTPTILWNFSTDDYALVKDAILKDHMEEEVKNQPIIPLPKEEKTVSEDFALKLVAVVANKEKIKDIE